MESRKKYMTRTINFGKKGDLSRVMIESYEKKFGTQQTSSLIRDLIIKHFEHKPETKDYKIKIAKLKIEEINKKRTDIAKDLQSAHDVLNELEE